MNGKQRLQGVIDRRQGKVKRHKTIEAVSALATQALGFGAGIGFASGNPLVGIGLTAAAVTTGVQMLDSGRKAQAHETAAGRLGRISKHVARAKARKAPADKPAVAAPAAAPAEKKAPTGRVKAHHRRGESGPAAVKAHTRKPKR